MKKRLESLRPLVQMVLDSELSKLEQASAALATKADELHALRQASVERSKTIAERASDDIALLTGQDALYLKWQNQKAHQLNIEMANLAAAREHQLSVTRTAFGRKSALDQLAKKARK